MRAGAMYVLGSIVYFWNGLLNTWDISIANRLVLHMRSQSVWLSYHIVPEFSPSSKFRSILNNTSTLPNRDFLQMAPKIYKLPLNSNHYRLYSSPFTITGPYITSLNALFIAKILEMEITNKHPYLCLD